ncbi:OLC1v1020950C5 [Oldenlandia corymbosa var. corymbosa]|uniref:OLC1v1020950C5 n=2 Tax=Oldenlandia corymbosa var. corymbosa TaxID=529605 RepID=A0AAV1BUL2_OLDCO|nr:OLC1v1020950C5 [Oldenlandia corymbosa var. corymbosa]
MVLWDVFEGNVFLGFWKFLLRDTNRINTEGMMMGIGSLGYGGPSSSSSSSSSNLSASAPPFTVDRFNLKPSGSNSSMQFPEFPAYGSPFGPAWQPYTNPRPDNTIYPKSELEIDSSTRTTSVPLPDDYGFQYSMSKPNDPASQAFTWSSTSPGPKTFSSTLVDSFYNQYAPPMADHDSSPSLGISEHNYDLLVPSSGLVSTADLSSQVDYTHGLEYGTQLHGVWNRTLDGKMNEPAGISGCSFLDDTPALALSTYEKQMIQGSGQFPDITARVSSNGLMGMERKDNVSQPVGQSVFSFPFNSTRTTAISGSSSTTVPVSSPNLSPGAHSYMFVTKPPPALVIRPPPSGKKTFSAKTLSAANVAAFQPSDELGSSCHLKGKDPQVLLDPEVGEVSLFTSEVKGQKDGNNSQLFSASSVMGEVSSKSKSTNDSKVNFESPVRYINASGSASLLSAADNLQSVKTFDIGPDCFDFDHYNFAVDSPCWKGAPASNFSPFGAPEVETAHQFGSKTGNSRQTDLHVDHIFPPPNDAIRCSSVQASEEKVLEQNNGEEVVSVPGNLSEVDCSVDKAKETLKGTNQISNRGVQLSDEMDAPREDYKLPTHPKNKEESKSSDKKQLGVEEDNTTATLDLSSRAIGPNSVLSDTTAGAIAVRAAENVLCSPSSEEGGPELVKASGGQLFPTMDVQSLIKVLQNVSDLLWFSFTDSCGLKDLDIEAIKHVINNLERLASKKTEYLTESKQVQLCRRDTCDKVGDSLNQRMSCTANKYQPENDVVRKSLNCLSSDNQMINKYVSLGKDGIFQPFNTPMDDLDSLGDDSMAQAIKKVLEENFLSGEEMESQQALLFKSLWLEAEAKLCSISYRVRFERMKMELQKFKSNNGKEGTDRSDKTSGPARSGVDLNVSVAPPSSKATSDSNLESKIWSLPKSNSNSNTNAVPASIMTKFDALKQRGDSRSTQFVGEESADNATDDFAPAKSQSLQDEAQDRKPNLAVEPKLGLSSTCNTDDVDASVMTRFHILKSRDNPKTTAFLRGQPEGLRSSVPGETRSQTTGDVNEKHFGSPHVGSSPRNQCSIGSSDTCSSDWEHILKEDDIPWR